MARRVSRSDAAAPAARRGADAPAPLWDDLKIFLAVSVHGSMNAAAAALDLSTVTVARRLRALEETLRVDLFTRGANALALTDAGRAVMEAAAPMGEAAGAIPRIAAAYRADPNAPVRITATTSITMFLSRYAPLLAAAAAPHEVAFVPTRRNLDLAAGEADIALRMQRPAEGRDLYARQVGRSAVAVFGSAAHPANAVIAPPDESASARGKIISRQVELIATIRAGRPIAARIDDTSIRYQAIKSGLGLGVLPCWLGDEDPDLKRLTEPRAQDIEDVYLLTHRRGRARPEVMRVAKALADLFRTNRKLLEGRAAQS